MKIKKIEIDLKYLFWTLFEELPEEKKDKFCGDSEFEFDCFRNSIKMADDEELLNEIAEVVQLLNREKIETLYLELLKNLYSKAEKDAYN